MNIPAWIPKFLPTALICMMAAAGLIYLADRQWWRAAYWLSGAMLNVAVTYGL